MKKLAALALAVAGITGAFAPAAAEASVSCAYGASAHQVTIKLTAYGDTATVAVNGTAIAVNGVNCGAATVTNTDKIVVSGTEGYQGVDVSLAGGKFAPGYTGEAEGAPEIEFSVALGSGTDKLNVIGSSAADNVRLGTLGMTLNGDADLDVTLSGTDRFTADAGAGNDYVSAAGSPATGAAYPLRVVLSGGTGDDVLTGGAAADEVTGGQNADTLGGGDESDFLAGGDGGDKLAGGPGRDFLIGDQGADVLDGQGGGDTFYASAYPDGDDVVQGGAGTDLAFYGRTTPVNVSLDGVANDGRASLEHDNVKPDVEDLEGGDAGDIFTGSDAANHIDGWGGADVVKGLGGDDLLENSRDEGDTLRGGDGDDHVIGFNGNDRLFGDADDDYLEPGLGNDLVDGGADADEIVGSVFGFGSDGTDDIRGGPGFDRIGYDVRYNAVQVILDNVANDGEAGEGDNVHADVERVEGGTVGDVLIGSAADNTLLGGGGPDSIDGGDGADYLYGDAGDDVLTGGDGQDTLRGDAGADSFYAEDGDYDFVDGGEDGDVDTVLNADPFDALLNFP